MNITKEIIDQVNENNLYVTIGIRVEKAGNGSAEAVLEPSPSICWPFPERPHGGIFSTLMDTTMAWAVLSQLDSGCSCATISMDIQYILPAKGGFFLCSARTIHRTGHLSFARAVVNDRDGETITAGQAVFRIIDKMFEENQNPVSKGAVHRAPGDDPRRG